MIFSTKMLTKPQTGRQTAFIFRNLLIWFSLLSSYALYAEPQSSFQTIVGNRYSLLTDSNTFNEFNLYHRFNQNFQGYFTLGINKSDAVVKDYSGLGFSMTDDKRVRISARLISAQSGSTIPLSSTRISVKTIRQFLLPYKFKNFVNNLYTKYQADSYSNKVSHRQFFLGAEIKLRARRLSIGFEYHKVTAQNNIFRLHIKHSTMFAIKQLKKWTIHNQFTFGQLPSLPNNDGIEYNFTIIEQISNTLDFRYQVKGFTSAKDSIISGNVGFIFYF